MAECRLCQYGVETFDLRGYRIIRCEARNHGLIPWWYVEGKSAPMQTPTFPYLATPDCNVWVLGKRFTNKEATE